jgi:DNA-binding Lrp family transcriptional regulator
MQALSPLARAFVNRYQGGFPLCARPFREAGLALWCDESTLIATVRGLLDDGLLSRFGPLYDAERLGGGLSLAAMAVPEPAFDRVAAVLAAMPQVAHNYRRDHGLNMWLVLATPRPAGIDEAIEEIESATGIEVLAFPKFKEYHLGFWLVLGEDGSVGVRRVERERSAEALDPDDLDRALIAATQTGLPLVPEPYAQVARQIDSDPDTVVARLRGLLNGGAIRRIGAVPNHWRLGLRGNGMSVWDIEDAAVDRLGVLVGALPGVSHCYLRPRRPPIWPYNLFAMVHGCDRTEVLAAAAGIESLVAGQCRGHRILFSEAVLKKTGLRFAA